MKKKPQISWGSELIRVPRAKRRKALQRPQATRPPTLNLPVDLITYGLPVDPRRIAEQRTALTTAQLQRQLDMQNEIARIIENFWDDTHNRHPVVPIRMLYDSVTARQAHANLILWRETLQDPIFGVPGYILRAIESGITENLSASKYLNIMHAICQLNTRNRGIIELVERLRGDFCRMTYRWFTVAAKPIPPLVSDLRQRVRTGNRLSYTDYVALWDFMCNEQVMLLIRPTAQVAVDQPAQDPIQDPFEPF